MASGNVCMRDMDTFEMCAYRRLLRISWKDHRTKQSILDELQPKRRLLDEVKRQKLQYFGHIARAQGLPTSVFRTTRVIDGSSLPGREADQGGDGRMT